MSRSIVHVRRKKKDTDPLRSAWHILEEWLEVNRRRILVIGGVAAGLVALFGIAYYFLEYRTERRQEAFDAAYDKFTATVGSAPSTPMPGSDKPLTFPDEKTKYTEAAAAFDEVADDYPTYRDLASYYAGLSYLQVDPARGVERLKPLADGDTDFSDQARLALAQHYDKAGDLATAETYLQKLADDPGNYPRFFVLNRLASVKERLNKSSEAAALYKTVVDADRNSPLGVEAEKGLQRVDPVTAASLPPKAPGAGGNPSYTTTGGRGGAPTGLPPGALPPGF